MRINEAISYFSGSLPKLLGVGKMVFGSIWSDNFHDSSACELLVPIASPLTVYYQDGRQYRAECGEVLILPQGTKHRDVLPQGNESVVFLCSFGWDKIAQYLSLVNNDTIGKISKRTSRDLNSVLEGISRDLAGGSEMDRLISATRLLSALMVLLRDVLAETGDAQAADSKSRKSKLLNDAKQYIENNFNRNISLDEIADALDVSSYYLSHVFSEGNDFPLFEYLLDVRMKQAGELLKQGKFNVAQVAYAVGYENPNYFSRTFKKYFGDTPSKWRNKATE
ncbi:MAG: AraC family transcriptional regulator [Phycisphaerae bacterium]|nr:AraC family transcriptional regulator [Phycisphaerae bacterium]